MTLATYNQCVDNVTGVSKTVLLYGRLGARHVGAREAAVISIMKDLLHTKTAGKHAKQKARYGKK
jgi:hypothetical protein